MRGRDKGSRRREMEALLAEQEKSGLSVARFARERGISAWSLYEWRRRLRKEGGRGARRSQRFVQVRVVGEPAGPSTIAVELPAGARVHVPRGFDEDELRRLLGVLESC